MNKSWCYKPNGHRFKEGKRGESDQAAFLSLSLSFLLQKTPI